MRRIREVVVETDPDLHSELKIYSHSEWRKDYPWMVQGITGADFDLRLFGSAPAGAVMRRWDVLRDTLGFERAAHAEQVHGNGVARHQRRGGPGIEVLAATDGHATSQPGVLLTVAVADCVPVFLLDPQGRRIAIVHAGWRGVVAGILGAGVAHLIDMGAEVDDIRLHLGPHICDVCYEVGPEVHEALGGPVPEGPTPVSLVQALERRAEQLGIEPARMTASSMCTRCDPGLFYSHRGGSEGRQVGMMGIRPS